MDIVTALGGVTLFNVYAGLFLSAIFIIAIFVTIIAAKMK
jgi:hypothetical protein